MKVIGLISGGKDSIYNLIECIKNGHEIICLGHLARPENTGEMDSYMYQTVGSEMIDAIAECLGLPLIKRTLNSKPLNLDLKYEETKNDEVEDLFELLVEAKEKFPEIQGVSTGAIWSVYQKNRVVNLCERLNLISLAYLWERNQKELLMDMINDGMESVLIKSCVVGLGKEDLLKTIKEAQPKLFSLEQKYKINVCGEGGEFESLTVDCPIYKKRINIKDYEVVQHTFDPISPVFYVIIKTYDVVEKN
jgi:diphthine-ammonia ligase